MQSKSTRSKSNLVCWSEVVWVEMHVVVIIVGTRECHIANGLPINKGRASFEADHVCSSKEILVRQFICKFKKG